MSVHESFHETDVSVGSDKQFGLTFSAVFFLLGIYPLLRHRDLHLWALAVAVVLLVITLCAPGLLAPLNRLWHRFSLMLARVTSPIVMGIMFVGVVVPCAVVARAFGKRFLAVELDKTATSYWILRHPPGPAPETLRNQF